MLLSKLVSIDEKYTSVLRLNEKQTRIKPAAIFFAHSGDSWFILAALFIVWLVTKGNWHYSTAVMAASTIILAILVLVIKFSIKRKRPEGDWGAIYRNTDPHSFPSGHAARTIMLAVLAFLLGHTGLGIVLIIWAPLVCLARVAMGVHYLSDVVAGAFLGIAAAFGCFALAPWASRLLPFLF